METRYRLAARRLGESAAALACAIVLAAGGPSPAWAADDEPSPRANDRPIGREELIGRLIPITGDPIEVRSVELQVVFRRNSAELTDDAAAQLRELGAAFVSEALAGVPIGVYGHTDASGPAEFNRKLSERRADAVAAYLREHFAISEARFQEVRGFGEERPRADLPATAPAQRRVEIVAFHHRVDAAGGERPVDATARESDGAGVVVRNPGSGQPAVEATDDVATEPGPRAIQQ